LKFEINICSLDINLLLSDPAGDGGRFKFFCGESPWQVRSLQIAQKITTTQTRIKISQIFVNFNSK
jgi:hypothetical protein